MLKRENKIVLFDFIYEYENDKGGVSREDCEMDYFAALKQLLCREFNPEAVYLYSCPFLERTWNGRCVMGSMHKSKEKYFIQMEEVFVYVMKVDKNNWRFIGKNICSRPDAKKFDLKKSSGYF